MTNSTPDPGPTQPSNAPVPIGAIIGIAVVALVGLALLGYALLNVFGGGPAAPATSVAQTTPVLTAAVVIPTVTNAPASLPSATSLPATAASAATVAATAPVTQPGNAASPTAASSGPVLNVSLPANIRTGPSTLYPIMGGLQPGSTANVVGRDAAGRWYVIDYLGGRGWISGQVAQYTGDTNALPVVNAPPPPATATFTPLPTLTSIPATATAAVGSNNGVRGDYFSLKSSATNYVVNQDIWFKFKLTNTTGNSIPYRCLGAKAIGGPAQCSWGSTPTDHLSPGQVIEWEDHINIGTTGSYTLALGICYLGDTGACRNSATNGWEILTSGIAITVN